MWKRLTQSRSAGHKCWGNSHRFRVILYIIPTVKNTNCPMDLPFSKKCSGCEHKRKLSGVRWGSSGLAKQKFALILLLGGGPAAWFSLWTICAAFGLIQVWVGAWVGWAGLWELSFISLLPPGRASVVLNAVLSNQIRMGNRVLWFQWLYLCLVLAARSIFKAN